MKILTTQNNVIVSWCRIGDFTAGDGETVYEVDSIPDEITSDDCRKWCYDGTTYRINPDYVIPEEPAPEPSEVEKLQEQVDMLTECILEMSELLYG